MGRAPSKNHTLDRIDNDADYTPKNVRWATRKVQNLNRRNKNLVTYKGQTKNLQLWADQFGIDRNTIKYRLNANWPMNKVFEKSRA